MISSARTCLPASLLTLAVLGAACAGCAAATAADDDAPGGAFTAAGTTTVRVHYDTGFGNRITLRGSAGPL
jgi:hypothetical protein